MNKVGNGDVWKMNSRTCFNVKFCAPYSHASGKGRGGVRAVIPCFHEIFFLIKSGQICSRCGSKNEGKIGFEGFVTKEGIKGLCILNSVILFKNLRETYLQIRTNVTARHVIF